MGPILFARNENIAHVMPRVTACAVTSCAIARHAHVGKPAVLIIRGAPEITYGHAVHASRTIYIKITASHFNALNTKIAKPERAGKDSHCHAQREHGCFK